MADKDCNYCKEHCGEVYHFNLAKLNFELEKENAESKQILYKLVNAFNDYECAGTEQEQENTWEILRDLMHEELFSIENGK